MAGNIGPGTSSERTIRDTRKFQFTTNNDTKPRTIPVNRIFYY